MRKARLVISDYHRMLVPLIAKNASSTLRKELAKDEYQTREIFKGELTGEQFQYRLFAFLRDPVERFCSAYYEIFMRHLGQIQYFKRMQIQKPLTYPFLMLNDDENYLIKFLGHIRERGFFDSHLVPQSTYLEDLNNPIFYDVKQLLKGILNVRDYCGLDQNLPELKMIRRRKAHHGKGSFNFQQEDLREDILEQIRIIYKDDIELYQANISVR